MPKVTLLPPAFEDHNKSMEVYAQELVKGFKAQRLPIEAELRTIHQKLPGQAALPADLPVKLRTKLSDDLLFKYGVYPRNVSVLKDELIHITDHSYGHLLYALPQKRIVITCHDLTLLKFEKLLAKNPEDKDKIDLFKYSVSALKKAAAVIADSRATQKDIEKYLGIPCAQITVIPLGVSPVFEPLDDSAGKKDLKKQYQLSGQFTLLHVGNNAFYKNISSLLKTVYLLAHKYALPVKLLKVGTAFTEFQKMLIRDLGLKRQILHFGDVPTKKLVEIYQLADLLVYPSLNEGFGLPALEAMACGTPAVVSDQGALPGTVGRAALLLKPKDPELWAKEIAALLKDEKRLAEMTQAGITRAGYFHWQATAERTYEVYQKVLNS